MCKKFWLSIGISVSFIVIFFINTGSTQAATTGWHKGYYYVENSNGEVVKDKIDLVGNYLIDKNGKRHKLNLTKKGNHTKVANKVAKRIVKYCQGNSDLEKVDLAAYYVSLFGNRDCYTMKGKYYNKPYGVFIAREYSCAGSTAALQKVLYYMGFKAKFINKNKFTHQWCSVKMDRKAGYADGQMGFANYGTYFSKSKNVQLMPQTSIMMKKWYGLI